MELEQEGEGRIRIWLIIILNAVNSTLELTKFEGQSDEFTELCGEWITKAIKRSPSWRTDSNLRLASQGIPSLLRNVTACYSVRKSPQRSHPKPDKSIQQIPIL
jgi:hypothetical protein